VYKFIEKLPSPEDYNRFRESAGWGKLDISVVEQSLPKSIYAICVEYNSSLVGFGRVVRDGGLCFYIQEIIVLPEHQNHSIGTGILEYIMKYISMNATKRSYVAAMVGKGLKGWYSKYGFWSRPTKSMGLGMMLFWDDPDYNNSNKV
jgi:ribosomal protein S18 acetylase RimI-like enzyme